MKTKLALLAALLLAPLAALHAADAGDKTPQENLLGALPSPGLYARLVEPAEYPGYHRRGFLVPTWKTFGDRPQLVGGRYTGLTTHIPESYLAGIPANDADVSGREWLVGRVYQPNIGIMRTAEPDFSNGLRHLREAGMYLFNVGGYGPGSPRVGGYGQLKVSDAQNKALAEILGERWLGFDLGEQDGRYHNGFESRQLPAPRDRAGAHRLFRDWCDRVIADQGGKISLLSVLWGWHYPTQDGAMSLIGAESESKCGITSPQVQYAFLRGAGKQYGVLWFGNVALFSAFGVKGWTLNAGGSITTEGGGSSLNLMRRLFLSQLLWNSCILSFEGGTLARSKDHKQARVSPLGQVQLDTERLIQSGFSPGVMQTPVAILQDYFSGWMPPRSNAAQFQSFNSMDYAPADFLTDALLSLIFPGYENSGWFFDESGALCPTPYGEIADCLLGDAPAEVLARYNLVLVSGIEHDVPGVRERLDAFCSSGGVVLATGDDAARLWPEYCLAQTVPVAAGEEVRWSANDQRDRETSDFDLHDVKLPATAKVLATCQSRPAVVSIPHGGGTLLLALASTGMNRTRIPCQPSRNPYSGHGENTGLERPFRLLAHVSRAYDCALQSQRLFTCGSNLTVTTCRRTDGKFVVGISNPSLRSQPFALESHIGAIAAINEVNLGAPVHNKPGYWPSKYGPFNPRAKPEREILGELTGEVSPADAQHIRGGDIRFFEVALKSCAAKERPDLKLPAPPRDRLLRVPDITTLRERLLAWPRFACCFDGVALDWPAICDTDPQWLQDHADWFRRHAVRMLVDARGASAESLATTVARLASYGAGAELLVDRISDSLRATGLVLRTANQVRFLAAGTTPQRAGDGIHILEGDWRSWDALYRDVRAAWLDPLPGRIAGPGKFPNAPDKKSAAEPRCYVSLHGISDLPQAIAERPGLLERFNGLMLEAAWLEARSREALAKDRAWLDAHGLAVVIDFTRLINRFPDLTFSSGVPHQYEESVRRFDSALEKMALLGARDAVICSHATEPLANPRPPTDSKSSAARADDWDDQIAGIERFLDKAAIRGVTVHWRTSTKRLPWWPSAHAKLVADLRGKHANLRIAACTVDETNAARLTQALTAAGKAELWLLASPQPVGGRNGVRYLPLADLPKETLAEISAATKGATQVFDADYLSWEEAVADHDLLPSNTP